MACVYDWSMQCCSGRHDHWTDVWYSFYCIPDCFRFILFACILTVSFLAFRLTLLLRNATQRAVLPQQVVCPSIHLSVTLSYRDQIGQNSSKIISLLVSLGCLLSQDPNIMDLLTLDIKTLQGHFSKLINYTTLCQVSASNRDVLVHQDISWWNDPPTSWWNNCSVVFSGRWRQSIPGTCSRQGEGAIAEWWAAHWQHTQRQCWSRRDTAMTFYITRV